jgi:hypothetical protein
MWLEVEKIEAGKHAWSGPLPQDYRRINQIVEIVDRIK